jgi:hypothetical protein
MRRTLEAKLSQAGFFDVLLLLSLTGNEITLISHTKQGCWFNQLFYDEPAVNVL